MAVRLDHEGLHGVAVAGHENQVFLAWVDQNDKINIISTQDGRTWSNPTTIGETSIGAPSLCSFNRSLYLAWVGVTFDTSGSNLYVMSLGGNGTSPGTRIELPYVAKFGPAITDFKATEPSGEKKWRLWLAWTDTDGRLFASVSADSQNWEPAVDLGETSIGGPTVWGKSGRAWIAWAGTNLGDIPHRLNVKSTRDGKNFEAKHTFSEGADRSPALVGFRDRTWLISEDRVSRRLTVRRQRYNVHWTADPVRYLSYGNVNSNLASGTLYGGFCLAWIGADRHIIVLPAGPGRIIANPTADLMAYESTGDDLLAKCRKLHPTSLTKGRIGSEPVQALLNEPCYFAHVLGHGSANIEKSQVGSSIAEFQGDLHVVWPYPVDWSMRHLRASRPKNWRAAGIPTGNTYTEEPTLCQFNGLLWVAWSGAGNHHLNLSASSNGETFTAPRELGETSPFSPAMAVLDGKLYMAYTTLNQRIVVQRTTDGQHWTDQVVLSETSIRRPSLIAFRGKLYLAWAGTDLGTIPHQINLLSSADGRQWMNKRTFHEGSSYAPAFAADGNDRLFLLWTAKVGTYMQIYSKISYDGTQWSPKSLITNGGPWSEQPISGPSAEFWNGSLHVSYTHNAAVHVGFFNRFGFHRSDVTTGEVTLSMQGASFGPSQVQALTNGPSELFMASSCLAASNDSLARAFFTQGTKYYLGFASVVRSDGASRFATAFFARWERENKSIWQVLDEIDDIHPLAWYLFENEDPNVV